MSDAARGRIRWVPPGADPTHIDLALNPLEQRMVGIATHGNTPFDVPYMSRIVGDLWQGGCANGLVLPEEIEHVVSLYPWESYTVHHELKSSTYVRLYDSIDQGFDQVDGIAAWVVACWEDGPTLVHCQDGLNRSSLIAARALMLGADLTADDAIETLRRERSPACLCNPAFEEWLRRG